MSDELTMGEEQPRRKKSKILPLLLVILILALCGGGYWYYDNMMAPAPMPMPQASTVKPKAKEKAPESSKEKTQAEAEKQPETASIPEFGNLEEYARLDAEASILKKKKEVVSLQAEIAKLRNEGAPKQDETPAMTPKDVEMLINRAMAQQAGLIAQAATPQQPIIQTESPVLFLSIEGVGNNIRATVREPGAGTLTLRYGSIFRGGKVTSITRNGVTVDVNGKKIFYPYQS